MTMEASDVRAVVDERLRALAEFAEDWSGGAGGSIDDGYDLSNLITQFLASAPREPAGEAAPAPPAGGEIEEAIRRIDSIAFEASYRRDWETVTAALAAARAEAGRLKTVWAMEGLMRRLLALALNDWEQEHGVRSGYEKDGADHWSAQARTVFASDPTDAIGTKILTERDEARAESDRLRAALEPFAKAAAFWDQPDSTLAAVMNPDNTPAAVFVRKGEPWNYEITVGHLRAARAARLT